MSTNDKVIPLPAAEEPLAAELSVEETRRIENLAVTDPITTEEHTRKKIELRARLAAEHEAVTKARAVTTRLEAK